MDHCSEKDSLEGDAGDDVKLKGKIHQKMRLSMNLSNSLLHLAKCANQYVDLKPVEALAEKEIMLNICTTAVKRTLWKGIQVTM